MAKMILAARQGDDRTLRSLLPYIASRRTDLPVKIGRLRIGTAQELAQSYEAVMKKVWAGQLALNDAQAIASLFEGRRRVIETVELEARLHALEQSKTKESPSLTPPESAAAVENKDPESEAQV